MMYACNGVDVKTGEVKENVGQWLKSYSIDDDNCLEDICQPLTGQTEAASLGINKKKDPHRYEALNYSFRVVPEIANWRLRDVWASAKPDNAWSTAMPLKNVIRDIRNDVNETRVQAQESL
jgi:hypothetical protein